jgi:DNA-binding transcriptional MerR regulator
MSRVARTAWTETELQEVEAAHPEGMTVLQIVDAFTARGERLTEATFRKYVQLGLLPRSVRVGRKGKHRGSQGLYPPTAVRQIDHIRRLMEQGFTIEEIQREFLFVRGDIEALNRQLVRVYGAVEEALSTRGGDEFVTRAFKEARELGEELVSKLEAIERRLSMRARMERAAV